MIYHVYKIQIMMNHVYHFVWLPKNGTSQQILKLFKDKAE